MWINSCAEIPETAPPRSFLATLPTRQRYDGSFLADHRLSQGG